MSQAEPRKQGIMKQTKLPAEKKYATYTLPEDWESTSIPIPGRQLRHSPLRSVREESNRIEPVKPVPAKLERQRSPSPKRIVKSLAEIPANVEAPIAATAQEPAEPKQARSRAVPKTRGENMIPTGRQLRRGSPSSLGVAPVQDIARAAPVESNKIPTGRQIPRSLSVAAEAIAVPAPAPVPATVPAPAAAPLPTTSHVQQNVAPVTEKPKPHNFIPSGRQLRRGSGSPGLTSRLPKSEGKGLAKALAESPQHSPVPIAVSASSIAISELLQTTPGRPALPIEKNVAKADRSPKRADRSPKRRPDRSPKRKQHPAKEDSPKPKTPAAQENPAKAPTSQPRIRPSIVSPRVKTPSTMKFYNPELPIESSEPSPVEVEKAVAVPVPAVALPTPSNYTMEWVPPTPEDHVIPSGRQLRRGSPSPVRFDDTVDVTVYLPPRKVVQLSPVAVPSPTHVSAPAPAAAAAPVTVAPAPARPRVHMTSDWQLTEPSDPGSRLVPVPKRPAPVIDPKRLKNIIPTGHQLRRSPVNTAPRKSLVSPRAKTPMAMSFYAPEGAESSESEEEPVVVPQVPAQPQLQTHGQPEPQPASEPLELPSGDDPEPDDVPQPEVELTAPGSPSPPQDDYQEFDLPMHSPPPSPSPKKRRFDFSGKVGTPKKQKKIMDKTHEVINATGPSVPSPYKNMLNEEDAEFLTLLKTKQDVKRLREQSGALDQELAKARSTAASVRSQLRYVDEELGLRRDDTGTAQVKSLLGLSLTASESQVDSRVSALRMTVEKNKQAVLRAQRDVRSGEAQLSGLDQRIKSVASQVRAEKGKLAEQAKLVTATTADEKMIEMQAGFVQDWTERNRELRERLGQQTKLRTADLERLKPTAKEQHLASRAQYYVLRWDCLNLLSAF